MAGIGISFSDLTEDEAIKITQAYAAIKRGEQIVHASHEIDRQFRHPHEQQWAHQPAPYAAETHSGVSAGPEQSVANAPSDPNTQADVDSAGIPWDANIHSGSKKRNANGAWAIRKNLVGPAAVAAESYKAKFARAGTAPSAAELNTKFGAPQAAAPMPQFAAPAIDYQTWYTQYVAVYGKLNSDPAVVADMFSRAGVTDINEFVDNATARQVSFGFMKQLELA